MSLIQEALKRQHEDVSKDKGGQPAAGTATPPPSAPAAAAPSAPPPLPTQQRTATTPPEAPSSLKLKAPRVAEQEGAAAAQNADGGKALPVPLGNAVKSTGKPGSKKKLIIAAVLLLAMLGAVVGFVVVPMLGKKPPAPPPTGGDAPKPNAGVATQAVVNVSTSTAPATGAVPVVVPPVVGKMPEAQVTPVPAVTPTEAPVVKKDPVIWPILTLQGVMGKPPHGAAIVNSDIISVGNEIEGVRLLAVDTDSATFSYKGDTKKVKVGSNTAQ